MRPTDVGAQKIDSIMLDTYGMVVAAFSVTNKANRTSIATRSTEFASKKEGNNCNVMITGVTYKLHLDIKSSRHIRIITTSNP